ncbi:trypsin-like peptidase domain-containing protein [Gemella sp. GH3]|uniref:S1C family serine protease n=1 Tax=unclassified Gemella TaxID=2624949 RepID=UPI0015D039EC|nr:MULTISPECIES: trypsin-like peptidase domain-containing protein [unclassified Gemella]MBF0714188.1 trypsin-like peptidase domain-containing protein [Gemella sp. GH3.1]NYS51140.1 trypsin-like peptidase domain-containing protein [Gemella sp. GH3]
MTNFKDNIENDDFLNDESEEITDIDNLDEESVEEVEETENLVDIKENNYDNRNKSNYAKLFLTVFGSFVLGAFSVFGTQYFVNGNKRVETSRVASSEKENSNQETTINAVSKAKDAVVSIVNYQQTVSNDIGSILGSGGSNELKPAANGSGVIYKKDGNTAYIVTNEHVIKGAKKINVILSDGKTLEAELVGSDVWTDLAILKINSKDVKVVMDFSDSNNVAVGETAMAIGSPLDISLSNTVTKGIVSAVDRQIPIDIDKDGTPDWYQTVIQTDAAINPGNSGGALINNKGELIGINELKISNAGESVSAEGIGFVIPANEVKIITEQLEKTGKVMRPALGIHLNSVSSLNKDLVEGTLNYNTDKKGIIIKGVESGSSAEKAGLKQYDIITKLNGSEVKSVAELRKYIFENTKIGDTVKVTYYRNGKEYETSVTLKALS